MPAVMPDPDMEGNLRIMKKYRHNANEISEMITLTLGGFPQKVLIEGKKKDLPVLITLHGGPGQPIPFGCGCRGLFPEFTDRFIMVYWDQLGCGINDHVLDDSFTVDSFVKMTEDLVSEIKAKFPQNKIFIFSTSWGSILSAGLLKDNPHAADGVVAMGQIIKNVLLSDEIKETLEHSKIPAKKMEKIRTVTIDRFTNADIQLISRMLMKYTDAYTNRKGTKAPMGPIIKGLLTSPDYSFRDFKAMMMNGTSKNRSLWKEIPLLNLTETLRKVEIPYIMLQGDTDIVASTKTAKELAETAGNPNLQVRVKKNTGHLPSVEMMEKLLEELENLRK